MSFVHYFYFLFFWFGLVPGPFLLICGSSLTITEYQSFFSDIHIFILFSYSDGLFGGGAVDQTEMLTFYGVNFFFL